MKSKFSSVLVAGAVLSLAGLVGLEGDAQVAAVRPAGADLLQTAAGYTPAGGHSLRGAWASICHAEVDQLAAIAAEAVALRRRAHGIEEAAPGAPAILLAELAARRVVVVLRALGCLLVETISE